MTCYAQSYCLEAAPLPSSSLISDKLSKKISHHILECSKFIQLANRTRFHKVLEFCS